MNKPNNVKNVVDLRGKTKPQSTIIAVGAGKGGVGKSFFSSSLAYFLAHLGHKTLLVDLDIGAANLHTWLGEGLPKKGINEFVHDPNLTLKDVVHHTQKTNLSLIPGSTDPVHMSDLNDLQKSRIMSSLFSYPADYIVLDLGAGTHSTTLDFFLMAQHHVVVFTPEPCSIENAYRFMKAAFYRKLRRFDHQLELSQLIDQLSEKHSRSEPITSPAALIKAIKDDRPDLALKLEEIVSQLQFEVVLNQARTASDARLGDDIRVICQRHFGLQCQFLGSLSYDNAVWQSLRQKKHLLVANPYSHLYAQIMGVARRISSASAETRAVS